ncbi:MAG: hypothetical protein AB1665_01230 [Candidatus Thermoplasmatota archaeon]
MKRQQRLGGCVHRVDLRGSRRLLVVECEGCTGESDLTSPRCYEGVLRALSAAGLVDGIVLSGYMETEYKEGGLALVRGIQGLVHTLDRMASRDPLDTLEEGKRREMVKRCRGCRSSPAAVMDGLRENLLRGLDTLSMALSRTTLVPGSAHPICMQCLRETGEDVALLAKEMERLKEQLLYSAYGIVPRGI